MRWHVRTAAALAATALAVTGLSACGSDSAGSSDEYVIGDITAVTGEFGAFGEALRNGVDLAVKEINADGGIDGKKLKLQSADDGGDKAEAIAQFRRFAANKSVLAIIGPNLSSNALATTPLANQSKVVQIASGAVAPWSVDFGKWVFRLPPVSHATVDAVVRQAGESIDIKKVALVHASDTDQSVAAIADFKKAAQDAGYDIVADVAFRTSDTDYSAMLTSIKKSGADTVFVSAVAVNAGPMLNQAASLGLHVHWVGDSGLLNPQLIQLGGKGADGAITATTYFPGSDVPAQQAFTAAYKKEFGSDPSQNSAFGYDAVKMLAQAIGSIDGDVTRDKVRDALAGIKFDGVTGEVTFPDGSGDSSRAEQTLVQVVDGTFQQYKP